MNVRTKTKPTIILPEHKFCFQPIYSVCIAVPILIPEKRAHWIASFVNAMFLEVWVTTSTAPLETAALEEVPTRQGIAVGLFVDYFTRIVRIMKKSCAGSLRCEGWLRTFLQLIP